MTDIGAPQEDEDTALVEALERMDAIREAVIEEPMEFESHRKRAYQGEELREHKQHKSETEENWNFLERLDDVLIIH